MFGHEMLISTRKSLNSQRKSTHAMTPIADKMTRIPEIHTGAIQQKLDVETVRGLHQSKS